VKHPLVSVIVPSYNHSQYIVSTIRSVLAQTIHDIEIIIVDDGSHDDTKYVLASLADTRIRLVWQSNRGAHAAINRGLWLARAPYCAILNSDDTYHPQRLEQCLKIIQDNPDLGLVGSYLRLIDDNGKSIGEKHAYHNLDPWRITHPQLTFKAEDDLRWALLMQNYWATTSNFFFPRETFMSYGPFPPLRYTHDWYFALTVLSQRPAHIITTPLVSYRIHSGNTLKENQANIIFETCWLLATFIPRYMQIIDFWETDILQRFPQLVYSFQGFDFHDIVHALSLTIQFAPHDISFDLLRANNSQRQALIRLIMERLN